MMSMLFYDVPSLLWQTHFCGRLRQGD